MADNTTLNAGTGGDVIASDDIAGVKYQRIKLSVGADGAAADAASGGGVEAGSLRVTIASDSTGVLSVDDNGTTISVDDGAGSLTVDNAALSVVGGGVEAAAVRVTIASDSTGLVSVDDNGGSLTVDGTVAATQSGTWNIGSITTLPTLAAVTTVSTVTNVATIGTSVTPGTSAAHLGKAEDAAHASGDTGVMALAVRRDADTTLADTTGDYAPLQVNAAGSLKVAITSGAGSGGTSIADGASFTRDTTSITPAGAVVESSAPTLTNGDVAGLSMTTAGALRVSVASGGIAGIVDDAAFTPATSEVLPIGFTFDNTSPDSVDEGDIGAARMSANRNIFVNIRDNAGNERGLNIDASGQLAANVAMMNGVAVTMGNGASGTGVQRVTLASDSTGVLAGVTTVATVTNITNQGHLADDAAFTAATTRVMMAGYFADETATDSVDEGDGGAARMTLDRKQIVTPYAHAAAGGCTPYKNLDVDETEDDIKTSAGKLFWIHATNLHASSTRYLKIYNNVAATVVVGTTVPDLTFPLPSGTNGFAFNFGAAGTQFTTGICIAATTGFADNDTGAPGANEIILNAGYL
jgi:hypothetical protein